MPGDPSRPGSGSTPLPLGGRPPCACVADKVDVGPGQLYRDLQNLLHDLNVVGQIAQLIGDLKGHYQVTGRWSACRPDGLVAAEDIALVVCPPA